MCMECRFPLIRFTHLPKQVVITSEATPLSLWLLWVTLVARQVLPHLDLILPISATFAPVPHRTCSFVPLDTQYVPQVICFPLQQICPKQLNMRHINTPGTDSSLSNTSCVCVRVEQLTWSLLWTPGWKSEESQQDSHWEKRQKLIVHNWRACLTIEYSRLENDCDRTNWPSKKSYCFIQAICKWDII